MAPQPANTSLTVHYVLRTRTVVPRFASIKEVAQGLGTREVMVPGLEISVYNVLNSAMVDSAHRYGFPVTVNVRDPLTVAAFYASAHDLAFPIHLVGWRADLFIGNVDSALTADLHQEARTAAPLPHGLFELV